MFATAGDRLVIGCHPVGESDRDAEIQAVRGPDGLFVAGPDASGCCNRGPGKGGSSPLSP
jgi:hypothetical protein